MARHEAVHQKPQHVFGAGKEELEDEKLPEPIYEDKENLKTEKAMAFGISAYIGGAGLTWPWSQVVEQPHLLPQPLYRPGRVSEVYCVGISGGITRNTSKNNFLLVISWSGWKLIKSIAR